jgi:hypothetical protein
MTVGDQNNRLDGIVCCRIRRKIHVPIRWFSARVLAARAVSAPDQNLHMSANSMTRACASVAV